MASSLAVTLFVMISSTLVAAVVYVIHKMRKSALPVPIQIKNTSGASEQMSLCQNEIVFPDPAAAPADGWDIRAVQQHLMVSIEKCYDKVSNWSEAEVELSQVYLYAHYLNRLLDIYVLDPSRASEAGKMEEGGNVEFNLIQLLEEVADEFDGLSLVRQDDSLVLDPCDDSVSKFANVIGDRLGLKRILSSLVNKREAVRWPLEGGNISVRAWAKSFPSKQIPNCKEYTFEVEKKPVWENIPFRVDGKYFVRVKDSSIGDRLETVRPMARSMGGDICVTDGKEGTCFKFNIFLPTCKEAAESSTSSDIPEPLKVEGWSQVVLLIDNEERQQVVERYLERLGVKVSRVEHGDFKGHLKTMKTAISERLSSQSEPEPTCIIFLIEVGEGQAKQLVTAVEEFRRDLNSSVFSKIFWLQRAEEKCNGLSKRSLICDYSWYSRLDISGLHQFVMQLPEFGGSSSGYYFRAAMAYQAHRRLLRGDLPLTGLKVLMVEDVPPVADHARERLLSLGANVHVCENGQQALDIIVHRLREQLTRGSSIRTPFDLILMDCEMPLAPHMNGFEATRKIRKVEQCYNVHTPIIAMTTLDFPEKVKELRFEDMDGHLTKQLHTDILEESITRICRPERIYNSWNQI